MASQPQPRSSAAEKRHRSVFDLPPDFFDSSSLLPSPHSSSTPSSPQDPSQNDAALDVVSPDDEAQNAVVAPRLTCNTCKSEFESLQDQRSHFKSDIHRFNVKLSIAGKSIVNEDDFDELTCDSFKDYDVSSISGSEDEEAEKEVQPRKGSTENLKQKLFVRLRTGERVSVWKCLVMNESEDVLFENDRAASFNDIGNAPRLKENEVIERLKSLVSEPSDNARFGITLLASGGHFAGCVFDRNSVVAHKTFHRYVVRAKAGKKQSSKDASGRAAHSAGASLRRYNELALKKEIQELLAAWKPYFDASSCVYIYAPSSSRQLLFDGGKPRFSNQCCAVRNIPLIVRRPTLKEARRLYDQLTQVAHTADEKETPLLSEDETLFNKDTPINGSPTVCKEIMVENSDCKGNSEDGPSIKAPKEASVPNESESEDVYSSTPLHEAAQSNNAGKVLELLEMGLDPCAKDERGQTPYMLASEKEVRNAFRRFMAVNLNKWDWHAAKVPSALTKEMEESQAAKQAEKDAKKKARAKELKKLRKAKEKKAQAEAVASQNASKVAQDQGTSPSVKEHSQPSSILRLSKEEELERARAAEREKRAAAAERRMAAAVNSQSNSSTSSISQTRSGLAGDIMCSCCNVSLTGKVPFHRYNYKYCSTSCMHVHRQMLEDG